MEEQKVYTQKQVTEMQQGFVQELKEIHVLIYNLMLKDKVFNNNEIRLEFIKILEILYNKKLVLQKDINIETQPDKE